MYRKISILIVGLLITLQLQAQSVKRLTLKEAIDLGVLNSKQLIVSNAKIKEAQAKLQQAQDKVIPEVGVSGTYLHLNTPNVSFSQESSSNGGSSDSPLASLANLQDVALLQVSASWPVFNGFKTRNTKIMNEYLEQAAQYDAQTTKSNVALTTAKAIYQYYELLETRRTIEENLKQEHQRVVEFKNQEAQNLLARNDRLKAELQMNNVELALTEVNNNVKLAEYNLAILLGLPDETIVEIDTVGMFELAKLTTWDEYLQTGLANRTELKSATVQVKAGESGYKIAKANRLPMVALTAGYVNAFIPNVVNITNALNGGVSLKYSITGAIHASHGMQEARARVEQAEASRQIMTDQVKVNIREKYLNCQKSLEQLAITEKAIEQAEENFQISQNKYKQGLLILSDYLEADVALLQARINYATTRAESMIAYYELQESVGTLQ
jgi:outer membrane protein TolC